MAKKPDNYHHGDLRNALITAAAELIEENSSNDFALSEAARRAGVSSAAPYRHFKDKEALLAAVAELAFLALTEASIEVVETYASGTEECIIELGKSYIHFVGDHPQFYDLMWGDHGNRAISTEVESGTSGFFFLVNSVRSWCERHDVQGQDALVLSVKIWGLAHGLAGLAMNRKIEQFLSEVDVYALFESSTHTLLEGLTRGSADRL
jgi:AcrR family transcriptional regulator